MRKKEGSVLFLVLILSLIGAILMAGLYVAYQRALGTFFPIRIYSNLREASSGTVTLLASYVDRKLFSRIDTEGCPSGMEEKTNATAVRCCTTTIKFKLVGYMETFPAEAELCLLSLVIPPGFSHPSVVGGFQQALAINCDNYPCQYGITVKAYGPRGVTSYVETVYVR